MRIYSYQREIVNEVTSKDTLKVSVSVWKVSSDQKINKVTLQEANIEKLKV